ncbi:unnamed protein product [Citrullus colocynthis]|uniref:Uncharacterized protein n=1 Tax=Citrullus colocynthis TaxID=252529 RepID=A0ABP0XQ35_9ROSI
MAAHRSKRPSFSVYPYFFAAVLPLPSSSSSLSLINSSEKPPSHLHGFPQLSFFSSLIPLFIFSSLCPLNSWGTFNFPIL